MPRITRSHVLLVATAFCMSFILVHAQALKALGVSSFEQVLLRLAIALPIMLLVFRGAGLRDLRRRDIPLFLLLGLVFSFFLLSAISAVALGLPIPVAVALVYTQPIFTAAISVARRSEEPTLLGALAIALGVSGAFLATGLTLEELAALEFSPGLISGFLSGFLYASYLAAKREARERGYRPEQVTCLTFALSLLVLLLLYVPFSSAFPDPRLAALSMPGPLQSALLLSFAVVSTAMPYAFLNAVEPGEVSPLSEGLLLLLDPALHVLWAFLLFGQTVSGWQYLGVTLIIASSALSTLARARDK